MLDTSADYLFNQYKKAPIVQEAFRYITEGLKHKYSDLAEKFPEVILPYHNAAHAEDVLHEALAFAYFDPSVDFPEDIELLAVAAVFHDAGFIERYDENEFFGASIAGKIMDTYEPYTEDDKARVRDIILATRVKFSPRFRQLVLPDEPLGKFLADADVSNFGREDFYEKADAVYQELLACGEIAKDTPENRLAFDKFRLHMVKSHKWQTKSAKKLRNEQKKKNIKMLEEKIRTVSG